MPRIETYVCFLRAQPGQYYPAPPYQMPPPPPPAAAPPPALRPVAVPQEQLLQTATIRNSVNLKKNSLALVPVDGNPRRLAVTFTFDSSVPCRCALLFHGKVVQAALLLRSADARFLAVWCPAAGCTGITKVFYQDRERVVAFWAAHTCVPWSPFGGQIRSAWLRVVWWCVQWRRGRPRRAARSRAERRSWAACRATVFVVAVEVPWRGCGVTQTQGAPAHANNLCSEARTGALSGTAAARRVTVFVVAVEEPSRGCAVTQTQGAPAPAVTYNDGGRTMVRMKPLGNPACYTFCSWHQPCRGKALASLQSWDVFTIVHWGAPALGAQ